MNLEIRTKHFKGVSFKFVCDLDHQPSWFCFEDEEVVRERWWDIRPEDIIMDAGAAFGSYAFPALALGAQKVIAWTPEGHKTLFNKTAEQNGWSDKVVTYDAGLWSRPGYVLARPHNDMPLFFETIPEEWKTNMPPNAFAVDTIDAAVRKDRLEKVDWIKIDVEGAEEEVLKGASDTIRKFKPRLLIENHLFKDPGLQRRCWIYIDSLRSGYVHAGTVPYHSISHSIYEPI